MIRRNNKAASQAETAELAPALSEAASCLSLSSAPVHATRGFSAVLLAKDSLICDTPPVATNAGLGFRSFFSIPSQSAPEASSSIFLTEDDVPPSNQLRAQQLVVVPEYTNALVQPEGLRLPEVALPLSEMKMQTAYAVLRTLRQFCCANPGALDSTAVATRR